MEVATLKTWLMLLNRLKRKSSSQIGGKCYQDLYITKMSTIDII